MSDSQLALGRAFPLRSQAKGRRFGSTVKRFLTTDAAAWIVPIALLLVWQAASQLGLIPPNVLSAPSEVIDAAWRLTLNGDLLNNIAVSAGRAATGFVIGGSLAFAFGLLNGVSRIGEKLTDTTFQMVRNIPNLAMVPLVILWFGIEDSARIFLVALGVFFPIYINTFHGIRTADAQLVEMGRSYGMSNWELFRRVILPGALPSIFVGLRYSLGIMWLTLIVAETIAANSGIGYMAMSAREFMQLDVVVLSILLYALLGKLADSIARLLERTTLQWHPAFQARRCSGTPPSRPVARRPDMVDDTLVRALLDEGHYPLDDREPVTAEPDLPPGGVAITIAGLAKSFGSNTVLHGIDLQVPPGQFLTVIGKSGCGKSTLLRILAGLDQASSGEVLFDGVPSGRSGHVARLMFQEPRLLPWARVIGNVEVGLGARRALPDARDRALARLAAVGLESRADDWPSVLSGGQKQRVALARALASSPNFLALDEPLGALDALTRIEMQGLVEQVWREQGFTAVLVTHDVTEAIILGDRVVLIEDGIIKLELDIDLPRPRRRGAPEVAALEEKVLRHLFSDGGYVGRRAGA